MVNPETGEIYVEAGDELTADNLATLAEAGFHEVEVINVDGITIGAYIRNTLAVDKNHSREAGADRHLSRHASGRAADAWTRPRPCSASCSSTPSATTFRRSAA